MNLSKLLKAEIAFCLVVGLAASLGRAGTVATPYEIGNWRGFRSAAITYTFDDNVPNQYTIAVPMFHAAGFKITLFTVINYWTSFTWSMAQTAASYGDEIGSHTVTHSDLTTLSTTSLISELRNSQNTINTHITNAACVTLAYPYCTVPNETYTARYYIAARGCSGQLVPSTPSDFYNISSFVLGSTGPYTTAASIIGLANSATNSQSWCVYLIHSIDVNDDYSPVSSAALQTSVNYLSTNQNIFWVETFGNVVRYILERNASSVTEIANTGSSITLQVTNNLTNPIIYPTNTIYNYPITIRRPLPANWPAATVSQSNRTVNAQLVTIISTNYVMFDVVPNGGDIVISKTVLPFSISRPVLTTPTNLTFRLDGQSNVTYTLYSSSDLVNWLPIRTNTLVSTYTNFTIKILNDSKFYRAQWMP